MFYIVVIHLKNGLYTLINTHYREDAELLVHAVENKDLTLLRRRAPPGIYEYVRDNQVDHVDIIQTPYYPPGYISYFS